MNNKKIIMVAMLSLGVLAGCGNQNAASTNNESEQKDAAAHKIEESNKTASQEAVSSSQNKSADLSVQIDESRYSKDQLEMIKLVNQSVKFTNESDKESYHSLFTKNSIASDSMSTVKIVALEAGEFFNVFDEQAQLSVKIKHQNSDRPTDIGYVFQKENEKWRILDID